MSVNQESHDCLIAEGLTRLQSMQAFHKDKTLTVLANTYRGPLAFLQHALGDFVHDLGLKRFSSLDRYIYVLNLEDIVFHEH